MELWNKNDEFRKEYIRCNTRSTLRRLRTLDGRSLGPDEQPPVIPKVVYERVAKDKSVSLPSAVEQEKQIVQVETEKVKLISNVKAVEQKKQTINRSEKPVKPAPLGNGIATISSKDEIEEEREEKPKQTKEEEELARKMEELRREEERAKLREQHLLEEKAKAKEALERKKRNAEKAQARAMLRLQKEAEQKEKVNSTDSPNSMTRISILSIVAFASYLCFCINSIGCGWSVSRKGRRKQGRKRRRRLLQ